ncbi:MAG: S-layer homology domain-containing protein [Firmicutes bacterium]|nr:S-layer homology domain-containing protein [Bacillota bacterium]
MARKVLCIMFCICVLLSAANVYASKQMTIHAEYDFRIDKITVTGNIPSGRHRLVMLQVQHPLKPGEVRGSINPQNASEVIFYTDDAVAQADGSYRFEFGLNDGVTGRYIFKTATAEPNVFATTVLDCVNVHDIESMLGNINEALKWEDIKILFEQKNAAAILGLNQKVYTMVTKRDLVYKKLFEEKTKQEFTFGDIVRFESLFEAYIVLAGINEAANPETLMKEHEEVLGYLKDAPGVSYTFNELLNEDARKLVYAAHKDGNIASLEELKVKFAETTFLYAVDKCFPQALSMIVEKNLNMLNGIEYSKYKGLTRGGDAAVKISGTLYPSIDNFIKAFNDETNAQYNIENPPKGGGSNGSGGGSGGGGKQTITSTIVPETPVVTPEGSYTPAFKDIEDVPWALEAIAYLKEQNVISGKVEGTFAPNDSVTREEFVKMIVLALGLHNEYIKSAFSDVPPEHWSSTYIQSAIDAELINGIDASNFGLGEKISRQDMSVIIYRAMKKSGKFAPAEVELVFEDAEDIADYAKEAVESLHSQGIINGISETLFAPRSDLTRAQAAKVIYEAVK